MIDFFALQQALYQRLKTDETLTGLVEGVYDYVPDAAAYPYVLFDQLTARRDSAIDLSRRILIEQVVRAYSNDADLQKGWQQVRDIATVLFRLFDYWRFQAAGTPLQSVVSSVNILRGEGFTRTALMAVQVWFM